MKLTVGDRMSGYDKYNRLLYGYGVIIIHITHDIPVYVIFC